MIKELSSIEKEIAFRTLSSSDQNLYRALESNIVESQKVLNQNQPRDVRNNLFNVIQDCKKQQDRLLRSVMAKEETKDYVDIRPFKKNEIN